MSERQYVIIGAGIAGVSAAEAIRCHDPSGRITLLSGERELPYARPMLSKAPLLSLERKPLALHSQEWYREQGIELLLGVEADRLDPDQRIVFCGRDPFPYDRCILATGAYNFIPPFSGREAVPLRDIRTLDDLRQVRLMASAGKRAVVIGGGVIGLEMAAELARYGVEVTVLEAMDFLMPRLVNRNISRWLQAQLPHLHIITGVSIQQLRQEGAVSIVEDRDGRTWPCEVLIVSCGVRANTALAQAAGIACERGIVVNERMETSAEGVYACGDCAQYQGFNAALWSQGLAQGAVAGSNAAGYTATYEGCDTSLVLNLDGVALFALGDLGQSGGDGYAFEESELVPGTALLVNQRRGKGMCRGLQVRRDGKLVGAALLGDLGNMYTWKKVILSGEEADA